MRLLNKVAIVTGAGTGIGRETAILFAQEGAKVAVSCRNPKHGMEVVDRITEMGGAAVYIGCDVTDEQQVKTLVGETLRHFQSLNILVNNAGIGLWGTVETMPPQNFMKLLEVNVLGVYLCARHAVPAMRGSGGNASIINIGSAVGLVGCGNSAGYCAAKGAVANLTRAMAIDHSCDGIRVNCVCPGVVDTPFNDQILAGVSDPQDVKSRQEQGNLLGRLEKPEEVARACLFLASEESSYMTGSMFMVDGGVTAR